MAEHDDKYFEHDFEAMLKKLDAEIKIPEIPDAQSIFEKAEAPEKAEKKVLPFKKYTKFIAAAAAVVLIAAIGPAVANGLSGELALDNSEPEAVEEAEMPQENEAFNGIFDYTSEEEVETSKSKNNSIEIESSEPEEAEPGEMNPNSGEYIDEHKAMDPHSSASSSSSTDSEKISVKEVLYRYFASIPQENPPTGGGGEDDITVIEDYINKKRSIDITVEEGSVSVVLYDSSAGEEIINAFWVEGTYDSSYYDGEYYVINLTYEVSPEELETDYYLPMAGDSNGTYTIPESNIFIPGKVTEGVISLCVEVDVKTGEYFIYASLV